MTGGKRIVISLGAGFLPGFAGSLALADKTLSVDAILI
jgi:hypothetical protein